MIHTILLVTLFLATCTLQVGCDSPLSSSGGGADVTIVTDPDTQGGNVILPDGSPISIQDNSTDDQGENSPDGNTSIAGTQGDSPTVGGPTQ